MAKNQNKPKYQQVQKPATKPAAPKKDLIQTPKDKWFWPAIAALAVIVFITFMSAMGNSFVDWDDHVYVYENPLILNPTAESFSTLGHQVVSLNYHPVTMWSLWLNASMSGTDSASAFIGTNILFHILNVLLVFVIFYRLTGRQLMVAFITRFFLACIRCALSQ
jgi:protein O-mannosyl-transferase